MNYLSYSENRSYGERLGGVPRRGLNRIALGLTNIYLKRCINKGLVKVRKAPPRRPLDLDTAPWRSVPGTFGVSHLICYGERPAAVAVGA
jgi:hypothetical protein